MKDKINSLDNKKNRKSYRLEIRDKGRLYWVLDYYFQSYKKFKGLKVKKYQRYAI